MEGVEEDGAFCDSGWDKEKGEKAGGKEGA